MKELAKIRVHLVAKQRLLIRKPFQISCNFDSVAQMISISVFFPCAILGALESPGRRWRYVLHHLIYWKVTKISKLYIKIEFLIECC